MTASAFCTSCPRDLGRPSLLQLRRQPGVHHTAAEFFAALTRAIVDATGYASKAENRKRSRSDRASQLHQCAGTWLGRSDRDLCRRPRRREDRCQARPISIRSPGSRSRCGCDADEALGQIKGDVDTRRSPNRSISPPTPRGDGRDGLSPPATSTNRSRCGKTFDPRSPTIISPVSRSGSRRGNLSTSREADITHDRPMIARDVPRVPYRGCTAYGPGLRRRRRREGLGICR